MKQEMMSSHIYQLKNMPLTCSHDCICVVLVLSGCVMAKRLNRMDEFKEGDAFFINANQVYHLSSDKGCVVEILKIRCGLFKTQGRYLENIELIDSMGGLDQEKEITVIYRDCIFLKDVLQSYDLLNGSTQRKDIELLQEKIIATLVSDYNVLNYQKGSFRYVSEESIERYYRILGYIKNHLCEKLTLQSAAMEEHMQKSYFASQWKQMNSQTFLECVNRQRLIRSEELLLFTDLSHAQIIQKCGFSDSKYFYKYFMEAFNETPKQYKEKWAAMGRQADYQMLDDQQARVYIRELFDQLDLVNTDTHLFKQYRLLKNLEYQGVELDDYDLELELLHPDNMLVLQQLKVNTWYGFDLIMNYVRLYGMQALLKVDLGMIENGNDEQDLLKMIEKSKVRFGKQVIKNWKFSLTVHDEEQFKKAQNLQKRIVKQMPGVKCGIQLS